MILNNSKPEYYTGYTDPRFYQSLICSDTILILVINLTGVLFISDCDIFKFDFSDIKGTFLLDSDITGLILEQTVWYHFEI